MKVVFAHNVYNRLKTLKDTIIIEREFFPDANISVAQNGKNINIFQDINNFSVIYFNETPHKIGCVNGSIISIKQLLTIDFDVLIFSHDDVRINKIYINIVNQHIVDIINKKYDMICRMPKGFGDNYYMMEVFYLSKNAVVKIFSDITTINDESKIPIDINNSISPEVWLYNIIKDKDLNINVIEFDINAKNYNELLGQQMGYYHKNIGYRGWTD